MNEFIFVTRVDTDDDVLVNVSDIISVSSSKSGYPFIELSTHKGRRYGLTVEGSFETIYEQLKKVHDRFFMVTLADTHAQFLVNESHIISMIHIVTSGKTFIELENYKGRNYGYYIEDDFNWIAMLFDKVVMY